MFHSLLTVLHVGFIVEVWHLPAILLVVIVVRVGAVMRRCNGFRVRRVSAIVEVHLRARLVNGRSQHLLGITALGRTHTDHPDEKHNDDDEDDSASNATGNVSELRAFGAMGSSE